jgi:electron transport complex protein RnfE
MILGRAEAFASRNSIGKSMLDALGMGLGFTFACTCLGAVRELLGAGTLLGIQVFPDAYEPWTIMILPGGAFFVLGGWLLLFNYMKERKQVRSA